MWTWDEYHGDGARCISANAHKGGGVADGARYPIGSNSSISLYMPRRMRRMFQCMFPMFQKKMSGLCTSLRPSSTTRCTGTAGATGDGGAVSSHTNSNTAAHTNNPETVPSHTNNPKTMQPRRTSRAKQENKSQLTQVIHA